jgi:ribosome-associated toxin RatA of RatAB toxin-antitoxin module
MVSIKESLVVNAPVNRVWEIVSDVDRDPDYWNGLSSMHNIRKSGNVVERRVTVGIIGREGHQVVKLNPRQSVELTMTSGPLKGSRELKLIPSEQGKKTKVAISWDFAFAGVPTFARDFVKAQLESGTKEALKRIAKVAEGGSILAPRIHNNGVRRI